MIDFPVNERFYSSCMKTVVGLNELKYDNYKQNSTSQFLNMKNCQQSMYFDEDVAHRVLKDTGLSLILN
jgi:hypothetical protein